jgi:hypothetical protein
LDELLTPTFKQMPCQIAARTAFEIARAGAVEVDPDMRADECQELANITESFEVQDYPLILSVGLGARAQDMLTYNAHELPERYSLQRGGQLIQYRLTCVACYDFRSHFNAEVFVPDAADGNALRIHYDAYEPTRTSPYDPHSMSAFTPVHAMYLRV